MSWDVIATYAGISAVFSFLRTWFSPHRSKRLQYFISAMVSIPVGTIVGYLVSDMGIQEGIVFAVVAASALIAENIINAILGFGKSFEKDPVGTIRRVKKLTGK